MAYSALRSSPHAPEPELRQEMVRVGRLIWERGYVAATDGNLSARLSVDRLLVTPSGLSKGFLAAEDLVVIDLEGKPVGREVRRGLRPSFEILMHLEAYRQRPDVHAVVHAHPPLATAFSIAGVTLARCVIPEVIVTLGAIPTAGYATPGTAEVPDSIRAAIRDHDAVILAHHGSLTVGGSLWEAYMRLEKVEQTAQITLAAQQLGRVRTLTPEAVARLTAMRQEWLRRHGRDLCVDCSAGVCLFGEGGAADLPVAGAHAKPSSALVPGAGGEEALIRQIAETVVRNLKGNGGTR